MSRALSTPAAGAEWERLGTGLRMRLSQLLGYVCTLLLLLQVETRLLSGIEHHLPCRMLAAGHRGASPLGSGSPAQALLSGRPRSQRKRGTFPVLHLPGNSFPEERGTVPMAHLQHCSARQPHALTRPGLSPPRLPRPLSAVTCVGPIRGLPGRC